MPQQPSAHDRRTMRRTASSSLIGCVLEWYDFYLYGFAAALVFGPLFFPNSSPLVGTIASLGTFAVGFIARPIGGVIFGHFGDRVGRKTMLVTTLMIMGIASLLIGLLPTYETLGVAAPVLLVCLRFLQGIGLGGEWGGAVLMVVEHSPESKRGFWGSVIQLGATLGQALATGLLFGMSFILSNEAFMSWGWRVPFILSILLTAVGLFIRLRVIESPEFAKAQEKKEIAAIPFREAISGHKSAIFACFGVYLGAITVPFFVQGVFLTSYGTGTLGLSRTHVLLGVALIHAVVYSMITLYGGRLSDKIGGRKVLLGSMAGLLVTPWLGLRMIEHHSVTSLLLGIVIVAVPMWVAWGAVPGYFASVFPTHLRYTGMSLAAQASTIFGGLVPLMLTAVMANTEATWPVAITTAGCAAFGLFALTVTTRRASGSQTGFERKPVLETA